MLGMSRLSSASEGSGALILNRDGSCMNLGVSLGRGGRMMAGAPDQRKGGRQVWGALAAIAGIAVGIGLYIYRSPQAEGARRLFTRIGRAVGTLAGKEDRNRKPIAVVVQEIENGTEVQKAQTIALLRYELTEPADFARVFPLLIRAAEDESEMVRNSAISVLGGMIARFGRNPPGTNHRDSTASAADPKIEESLVGLLSGSSPNLRASAAGFLRTLAAIRQLDAPPPQLVACLDDESAEVRVAAANSLIEFGQGPELFLPVALRRLPTEGPEARGGFTHILWNIRFLPTALPLLIEALSSDNPLVRVSAATAINHMGLDATPARSAVMTLLRKELEASRAGNDPKGFGSVDIIEQTSEALVQLSPEGDLLPGTIEILCEVLKSPKPMRQQAAAWSLGVLGRTAAPAVPLLISAFETFPNDPKNPSGDFDRGTIALSLAEITRGTPDADRVSAALAKEWKTARPALKSSLSQALQSLGPKSEQLVPELRQSARDSGPSRIGRGRSPRSFLGQYRDRL
jgi:HEAT repeat protein